MEEAKIFKWYAVKTKPRWEKKILVKLSERGIESYCPLQKRVSQWSDRKKIILEPVFRGFIFVRVNQENIWDIKKVDGIVNYIYFLGKPAVVRDKEIDQIRKFLDKFENQEIEQGHIHLNGKVRVTSGPLMNYEGILLEISGNKAIVRIDSMGIFLSAHINKNMLESINSKQ